MKLEKLLEEIDYTLLQGTLDTNVSQIDYDSRTVIDESLFVCIPGAKVDGHDFIDQVIESGAKTIVVEHSVDYVPGITYIQVQDGFIILRIF